MVVRLLLEQDHVNADSRNNDSQTPLWKAVVVRLLNKAGSEL